MNTPPHAPLLGTGASGAAKILSADGAEAGVPGFTHRRAQVNGARIHYVMGGQGPAVVLLHGWPYTGALWRKLMPRLADAGFTVIAPDRRGPGDSARAETGYTKTIKSHLHP